MTQLTYLKVDTAAERVLREAARADPLDTRLAQSGPGALSLTELLSVLLDAKNDALLAPRLLAQWSTLNALAHASPHDLRRIEGITARRVNVLRCALELARREPPAADRPAASNPSQIAAWLMPKLSGLPQEQFWVVLLDTKMRIVSGHMLYQGNVNSTIIRAAEVFAEAVRANVPSIVIAHSHPSGDACPSPEDACVSRALIEAGKLLDITLLDHLVIGNGCFTSLKERGLAGFTD